MSFFAPIQSVPSPVAMQGQQLIRGTRGRVEHPHRVYGPQLAAGGVEVGAARHQERCQSAKLDTIDKFDRTTYLAHYQGKGF